MRRPRFARPSSRHSRQIPPPILRARIRLCNAPGQGPELSLAAEVGVAAIYLTSALGDAIGNTLSGAAAYVAAPVTLIIALVLVVIGVISTPQDARVEAPRATAEVLEESAGAQPTSIKHAGQALSKPKR